MSLRKKVVFVVASILVAASLGLYFIARNILLESFDGVERREGEANLRRLAEGLDSRLDTIKMKVRDWGWWDDTANFVLETKPDFAEANITK